MMALLSAQDEQVLKEHLSAIEKPVTLLLFTQTIGGSESGPVARQVLDEIARLNDHVTIEE
ncbi:MAG: protein disulfide oxidoreductase, partial [Vicinamibacterales bacterium]